MIFIMLALFAVFVLMLAIAWVIIIVLSGTVLGATGLASHIKKKKGEKRKEVISND